MSGLRTLGCGGESSLGAGLTTLAGEDAALGVAA